MLHVFNILEIFAKLSILNKYRVTRILLITEWICEQQGSV